VLVVTDESTIGVGGESGLAGTGETEEEGDVAIGTLVGGRVEGKVAELDGLEVVHDGEDTLLHLTGVLGTENDHLATLEVDLDGRLRGHAGGETVGGELAGVIDGEIGCAEVLELLLGRADEHWKGGNGIS
jgi:hypothetical protein